MSALSSARRQALDAYPNTVDEDLALLRHESAAPRGSPTRAAIQVWFAMPSSAQTSIFLALI